MDSESTQPGMDTFTRRYLLVLIVIAIGGLVAWLASWDSRVGELNALLESDSQLSAYSYQFKVQSLENGVAEVSSPRSAQVSVMQFLRIVDKDLQNVSVTDPAMMKAQDELVQIQSRAAKLLTGQSDVDSVRWSLDKRWYSSHGVYID